MLKQNLFYSSISSFAKLFSNILLVIVLARFISLNDFGVFTFALAFSTIWTVFADYGFSIKLLTDLPINICNTPKLITIALFTKLFVIGFAIIFFIIYIAFAHLTSLQIDILILMCLATTAQSFGLMLLNAYKATNRYHVETACLSLDGILTLILCGMAGFLTHNVFYVAIFYCAEKVLFLIITLIKYLYDYNFEYIEWRHVRRELYLAWPYAAHFILGTIYLNVDTIILKFFVTNSAIGIYQAGMRIVIGSGIALAVANSVMLPRLSKLFHHDRKAFIYNARYFNWAFIFMGIFFAIFLIVASKEFVIIMYGEKFLVLSNIMWLFASIIFLRYFGGMYGVFITVSGNQSIRAIATLCTLLFVVISDIFVIPKYGIVGAGIDLLLAHVFLNVIYLFFTLKEFGLLFVYRLDKPEWCSQA